MGKETGAGRGLIEAAQLNTQGHVTEIGCGSNAERRTPGDICVSRCHGDHFVFSPTTHNLPLTPSERLCFKVWIETSVTENREQEWLVDEQTEGVF
ncbi:hypothetical protein CHARACLAT_024987 [Characodon lateralis]|uniref:Uncharacterized protein n=1 Tax=Characodon lateralis TaxID=208331 RepID=A0ABU7DV90_9TELE|nr:hypothetical protein [Characodon lateralis]